MGSAGLAIDWHTSSGSFSSVKLSLPDTSTTEPSYSRLPYCSRGRENTKAVSAPYMSSKVTKAI